MRKIILSVLVVVMLFASNIMGFASASNPVQSDITPVLMVGNCTNGRAVTGYTTVFPYTPTKVRVKTAAVKYPSGDAWLELSFRESYSYHVGYGRTQTGYTGKITAYGTHDVFSNGGSAASYTIAVNQ